MKQVFTVMLLLLLPVSLKAHTVKYTYNILGRCTSRTEISEETIPKNTKNKDSRLRIGTCEFYISIDANAISVNIVTESKEIIEDYTLSNILGQTIAFGTFSDKANVIDISKLPSGIYVITFISGKYVISQKLIKP